MSSILDTIQLLVQCGTALAFAFLVLLAMPQSKLRGVVLQVVGWLLAIFCGVYAISPADALPEMVLGPFGLLDDFVAIVVGCVAVSTAIQAGKDHARLVQAEAAPRPPETPGE